MLGRELLFLLVFQSLAEAANLVELARMKYIELQRSEQRRYDDYAQEASPISSFLNY
jgi:hypothetical protein